MFGFIFKLSSSKHAIELVIYFIQLVSIKYFTFSKLVIVGLEKPIIFFVTKKKKIFLKFLFNTKNSLVRILLG